MLFKASAPGSLMLLGEYAVLSGGPALVAAINQRMRVELKPRTDQSILISSELGEYQSLLSSLSIEQPFQFILTVLKRYQPLLPSGCEIAISSEFSDQMGFASSAAVTVATLRAIKAWLTLAFTLDELILEAREIIREVQTMGSGADVAACVLGGVVAYQAEPFSATKTHFCYPLTVVYSGSKTKTVDAIRYVNQQFESMPKLYNAIMQAIQQCAEKGIEAALKAEEKTLGNLMTIQQGLMKSLGVSTPKLDELLKELMKEEMIIGAKISGSGLGDCIVGLGGAGKIQISEQGVRLE